MEQKIITIEEIDKLLTYPTITTYLHIDKEGEFNRCRTFKVQAIEYTIVWWKNISYLHIGNAIIPFTNAKITNTWPHNTKNDIQFLYQGSVVCILPIDFWNNNVDTE